MTVPKIGAGVQPRAGRPLLAIALMLLAALSNTVMAAGARHVALELPILEVAFFRHFLGGLLLTPMFLRVGFAPLRTAQLRLHLLRAAFNVLSMLSFFIGLTLVPLATVMALGFTSPLFAMVGAVLVLGEAMRGHRWLGLALGFVGALVILRPGIGAVGAGELILLGSAVFWAAALLCIKVLGRADSSVTIVLYATILQVPFALVPALFVWVWPTWDQLAWLVGIAACGTLFQISLAQAFREGDASVVLPADFSKLAWASLIGYLAFAEIPDFWTWIGGTAVFSGVIYVALRERRVEAASR